MDTVYTEALRSIGAFGKWKLDRTKVIPSIWKNCKVQITVSAKEVALEVAYPALEEVEVLGRECAEVDVGQKSIGISCRQGETLIILYLQVTCREMSGRCSTLKNDYTEVVFEKIEEDKHD